MVTEYGHTCHRDHKPICWWGSLSDAVCPLCSAREETEHYKRQIKQEEAKTLNASNRSRSNYSELLQERERAKSLESQLADSQYNYERLEATCDEHFKTIIMLKQHRHEAGCQIAARDSVIRELQAQLKAASTGPTEKDLTIGCLKLSCSQKSETIGSLTDQLAAEKLKVLKLKGAVQAADKAFRTLSADATLISSDVSERWSNFTAACKEAENG